MKQITYRKLEKDDYENVKNLINNAFEFNQITNEKLKNHALTLYLHACLLNSSFSKVAVYKGEVIGVILGKSQKDRSKKFKLKERLIIHNELIKINIIKKENRELLNYFNAIDKVYNKLMAKRKRTFDGSIELFIVSAKYRGIGLGKTLLKKIYDYFLSFDNKSIYLYTDTNCNYKFYDSQNFNCIGAKDIRLSHRCNKDTIFLYKIDL
ncbi:GNAT family N-acetyltransferase [Staphylococcus gallinarum]|uniref:GNAT family N-acetyltransferase n=1 Tax=Staphylococcus gallinarum TaxID=1293 RepID=UPI001E445F0F|nr:GNAT family N-acetyltransferase [Staphylococcus gallinarum]MCD8898709.1 GNAT family N-acetyltransferase [Staphylococcus gallinarum]MCD8901897.1 GNAT family N-acetyltransferase [Staphylococcus gallinarum]MEB6236893.1 GNAT family N-acetyltransferase [Staphylococcus gallinarum]